MVSLTKYLQVFSLTWQNGFTYRISLLLWRMRQLLATLLSLTLWNVLFSHQTAVFSYSRDQMLTYLIVVSIIQGFVLATLMHSLAADIYQGQISSLLTKPINIIAYLASQDLADKLKNLFFVVFEAGLLVLFFRPNLGITSGWSIMWFVGLTLAATYLFFQIMLIFGCLGFYSPETWAPRFLLFVMIDLTTGRLFPLDILPAQLQTLLYLTPFPYISYLPAQVLLNRIRTEQVVPLALGLTWWIVALTTAGRALWYQGRKHYSATGQ